jgi:hypothetical protein
VRLSDDKLLALMLELGSSIEQMHADLHRHEEIVDTILDSLDADDRTVARIIAASGRAH